MLHELIVTSPWHGTWYMVFIQTLTVLGFRKGTQTLLKHACYERKIIKRVLCRENFGDTCEQHCSEGHDNYKPQSKTFVLVSTATPLNIHLWMGQCALEEKR